jgi:hypothetical protein
MRVARILIAVLVLGVGASAFAAPKPSGAVGGPPAKKTGMVGGITKPKHH